MIEIQVFEGDGIDHQWDDMFWGDGWGDGNGNGNGWGDGNGNGFRDGFVGWDKTPGLQE